MKTRFATIDVAAAANDLKLLEGCRVVNVYDINNKTYIIKLSRSSEKASILFESGIRIHRTYHEWEKSQFPSGFSLKLRKHLNQLRLNKVRQLSFDRVIDLEIGEGARCVHVIVELYDRGNVLLTDSTYTILNVLRPRTDKDKDVKFSVNQKYPVPAKSSFPDTPAAEEIVKILDSCDQKSTLKRALATAVPGILGGALIEHVLLLKQLDPNVQVSNIKEKNKCASDVTEAMSVAADVARRICESETTGYLSYEVERRADNTEVEILKEFHPYLFCQNQSSKNRTFPSFCEAVDTYYATIDTQKQQQNALKVEKEAIKKLENVKNDQNRRLRELEYSREEKMLMAELLIYNQTLVDNAIRVVCAAVAQKRSWGDIEKMHAEAVENGDPVAEAIAKFDLNNNRIIMRLRDGEEGTSPKDVPVSIDMNAYGNACSYYKGMKDAAEKRVRTEIAAEKAIKNAEEKALTTIKKANVNVNSAKARKEMWFEKFTWFISSESYVVVCGRDATQNELLVKKYLRPEDIYVHAEAHGAASVVIRNRPGGGEIPPKTLTEAAQMATCFTKAWGSQVAPSSWWVYAHQVSKVTQTGEYLTKGSFVIRGKKNFLPSCPLSLGFGILFRVDEVSAQKYQKQLQEQLKNQRTAEVKEEPNENVPPTQKAEDECPALASDGEYPDISLDVPLSRLQLEDKSDEVSVIDIAPKQRKKAKVPTKELETKEYLEKKAEEERKAAAAKKIGKRQKHKLEKIRKKYADQDDEEREVRMNLLGSRGKKKNTADKGKQEAVFSPKTQSSKSNRDEGKCETAKSTKKESSPQAYMEFEVCDGKDKRYQLKTQVHPEHGEDVVSASTQNSKLDCRDIPTEAMQNSGFDHDNAVSDRTQKTVTESEECVSEATQSTGLDLENSMLEATQNTESNHDDSGLETAQNTELDEGDIGSEYNLATLDSTQTTELDRGDIGSESTESFGFSREVNESGDHRDVRFDREANENGHHPGAEGSADDDLPSESTQSLGQDHEASGNLSDHDPEHALADEKPLDVTQEDEEAHKQELQGPEEDDAEDDLKEFAATEGTEVLIAQLVSNPDPEDVLLYAVPMVGPYQAFHNFKYKVKITPGTTRKGKAGKAAVDLFLRNKNAGQVEKELIRAMAGDDKSWTNIPSGCRVSAPQLHAKK